MRKRSVRSSGADFLSCILYGHLVLYIVLYRTLAPLSAPSSFKSGPSVGVEGERGKWQVAGEGRYREQAGWATGTFSPFSPLPSQG